MTWTLTPWHSLSIGKVNSTRGRQKVGEAREGVCNPIYRFALARAENFKPRYDLYHSDARVSRFDILC